MSDDRRAGPGFVPRLQGPSDHGSAPEVEALAEIEDRLADGTLSPEEADRMILEVVLKERFGFLPPDALEELRVAGLELLEEPELVETRIYATAPAAADKDPREEEP